MKKLHLFVLMLLASFNMACNMVGSDSSSNKDSVTTNTGDNSNTGGELQVAWVFKSLGETDMGVPITELKIKINNKEFLVVDKVYQELNEIAKADFKPNNIPENALIAIMGFWAGGGSNFYAIEEGGNMVIYKAETDSSFPPSDNVYKLFKTIESKEYK